MNIVDVVLIIIIVLSVVNGISRGFLISAASLLSWLGSLLLALCLYPYVAEASEKIWAGNAWTLPLSFIFVLIITGLFFTFLFHHLARLMPFKVHRSVLNKVAGALPGVVTGILYAAVVAMLLLILPLSKNISLSTRKSRIAQTLTLKLNQVEENLKPELKEFIDRSMSLTTIEKNSKKRIDLPFSVKHPKVRADLEKEMLDMLNKEREMQGLAPLRADSQLTIVARAHCRDMFARSYFSHLTPEGTSPFQRMHQAHIFFLTAGENIALAQTVRIAHHGLMHSPGHRANILNPSFGRVGIGILDGGIYGLMITQDFRN